MKAYHAESEESHTFPDSFRATGRWATGSSPGLLCLGTPDDDQTSCFFNLFAVTPGSELSRGCRTHELKAKKCCIKPDRPANWPFQTPLVA